MEKLFTYFLVAAFTFCSTNCKTTVTLYDEQNYLGKSITLENLEDHRQYSLLSTFNDLLSSFKFESGSCVKFIEHTDFYPNSEFFFAYTDLEKLEPRWDYTVSVVKQCNRVTTTHVCPSGTFVKKVEWNLEDENVEKRGIKLHCFTPAGVYPASTILSTTSLENFVAQKEVSCPGVRGLLMTYDEKREIHNELKPICDPISSPNPLVCSGRNNNEALTGITVEIEEPSNFIKSLIVHCSDVGFIEESCKPFDKYQDLFICDATKAVAILHCTLTKTVGAGLKNPLSKAEINEKKFYHEFGFEEEESLFGLSENFRLTLGLTNTTSYKWEESQASTWSKEFTFQVKVEVLPGCSTTIKEVVGTCSFLSVRPNIILRDDDCNNKTLRTRTMLPINNRGGKMFVIPIPKVLLNSEHER